MHPRSLKSMCIDDIVNATVRYLHNQGDLKEVFRGVRELWKELFGLQHVHEEAVSLLHDRLRHTKQQPGITTIRYNEWTPFLGSNTFPCIVALLAAGTKELLYKAGGPSTSEKPLECVRSEFFTEINNVTTLKVFHGWKPDNFLVQLLPCCHKLTTLVIEGAISGGVLQAARQCPLQTLTLDTASTGYYRVEVLPEVILGIPSNSVRNTLEAYMEGQQVPLSPTWPSLNSLTIKGLKISFDFLPLVLVAHPNLEQLDTGGTEHQTYAIKDYIEILTKLPLLHQLSLTSVGNSDIGYEELLEIQQACPKLQHVQCITIDEESFVELLQLECHKPNLTHLGLLLHPGTGSPLQLPMEDEFEGSKQITTLELVDTDFQVDARWLTALLKLFPCLKTLNMDCDYIYCAEEFSNQVGIFPSLTSLQYIHSSIKPSMNFLSMFPNLYKLTLTLDRSNYIFPLKRLTELKNLRVLRLKTSLREPLNNILDLCQVPRETPDGGPWILYVAEHHVPEWVAGKLQRAGWTWRPIAVLFY